MKDFLSWPKLGGWLTIANMLMWLPIIGLAISGTINEGINLFSLMAMLLSLPGIFCFCIVPEQLMTLPMVAALLIVLNSFLWGYGLELLVQLVREHREHSRAMPEDGN